MGLLNIIRTNPDIRVLFGERELKIIEKQLLGINLKPSERTRLSRDIMRKFRAIKALAPFQYQDELKKGSEIKKIIKDVTEDILKSSYFPRIKRITLFGSTVENQRTFRSDIDIAVEFDNINLKEATEFRVKFSYNKDLDIQVYNTLPDKIKSEIDKKGRVLYEK